MTTTGTPAETGAVDLSGQFLRAVRTGADVAGFERALADLPPGDLAADLADDAARTAFWLNVYNAAVQVRLERDPGTYESKRRFFGEDCVTVAGTALGLDDVEHGLLRGSKLKWGLGYLPAPFPGAFERRFRVREPDPRVHFALNCGATSCPAIAAYSATDLDAELDAATAAYLGSEVEYDPGAGVVFVPRLFLWFRGDFGGKSGILALLRDHDLLPPGVRPRLKHREYDWSMSVGDFRD